MVKDELSIIKELMWISGFWIFCSFCYFLLFSIPSFYEYDPDKKRDLRNYFSYAIFAFILIRNYSTVVISSIFCYNVVRSSKLVYGADDSTSLKTLLDFELVMISVVPYKHFKRFVNSF
jgi:hypothetical protein